MNKKRWAVSRWALWAGMIAGAVSGPAMAQQTSATEADVEDEIVVTGVRASLQRALSQKEQA